MRIRSVAWAFVVGGWHRTSSLHLGQSGESPVEARVVVSGHLVGDIVVLAVVVVVVLVRSSHQGAVELVTHGGPPVVRMSGELAAVSDLVAVAASVVPVVAQQVVDLLGGPLLQLAGLDAGVSGYQGNEGGVTGVSVRAPFVPPGEATGSVGDTTARHPGVEESLNGSLVLASLVSSHRSCWQATLL